MNKRIFTLIALFVVLLWLVSPPSAYSNQLNLPDAPLGSGFTYQGFLKDVSGAPIHSTCDFIFQLFDSASGGTKIGADSSVSGVSVNYGYFSTLVNDGGEFGDQPLDNANARWLQVWVRCSGDPSYTSLSPRQKVSGSLPTHDHIGQTWSGGSVGLFINDASWQGLKAEGSDYGVLGIATDTTGDTYGVYGSSASTSGSGVYGFVSAGAGTTYGVFGESWSSTGSGVYGKAFALEGVNKGVYGESFSISGIGVYGRAVDTSGINWGVYGQSESTSGTGVYGWVPAISGTTYGVYGKSDSTTGVGVYGWVPATIGTTYGVYGKSDSINGYGVYGTASFTGVFGHATAYTGINFGVYGQSESTDGSGVYGVANADTGVTYGVYGISWSEIGTGVLGVGEFSGVRGESNSTSGSGVDGLATASTGNTIGVHGVSASTAGTGVFGVAWASTGEGIGVYGTTYSEDEGSYAGYFAGRVYIGGPLINPGGSLKIDHPLDPENQFLFHSYVESPEMKNVYDGVVTLDANGEAWVELPRWFEALNKDFRYQLTPIGASMPDLYVAQKIQDNRFKIAGGLPGMEVSWLVTGVRHDPWAVANRQEVEQTKSPEDQGLYLHPELYGQPAEQGIGYMPVPETPVQPE